MRDIGKYGIGPEVLKQINALTTKRLLRESLQEECSNPDRLADCNVELICDNLLKVLHDISCAAALANASAEEGFATSTEINRVRLLFNSANFAFKHIFNCGRAAEIIEELYGPKHESIVKEILENKILETERNIARGMHTECNKCKGNPEPMPKELKDRDVPGSMSIRVQKRYTGNGSTHALYTAIMIQYALKPLSCSLRVKS
ncbi:hypothetical protein RLOatenuis_1100 [Rickettsiales bacterium]|nr:hypothetical protein RLOatenuis_1100 [Rickettsiales bacterium]